MMHSETNTKSRPEYAPSRKPKRGWGGKLFIYALVAGLLTVLGYALRPKPILVDTASVSSGPLEVSVLEEGKTRIRNRYVLYPPVAGFLNRVELREGAPIKAGETVLATLQAQWSGFLDPRTRAQTDARLDAAKAAKDLRQSEIERIKTALDLAEKEFSRSDTLRKQGVISQGQWDAAQTSVLTLKHELESAESALRVADFDIAQVQAALEQETAPEPAKSEPITIKAPIDGVVLRIPDENARVVTPAAPLMEVGDPGDLEIEAELFSSDAVRIAPGAPAVIEQWGGDGDLHGTVGTIERSGFTKISSLGVEEQRVKVHVTLTEPVPEGYVLGDRFRVEVRIVTWQSERTLQIPTGALFRRGNEWMTFAVENGKASLRKVAIGHNNGVMAEVLSGIAEGATVIVHPPDSVKEGIAVTKNAEG